MSGTQHPLFSVIVVCLDAEEYISEALDSVLGQPFDSLELIVVDGGSADRTLEIVRERETGADGRVRVHSGPDDGLYDAMNIGLEMARGDYVVYLGADDRMAPGALVAVAEAIERNDRPQIVCGATRVFGAARSWVVPARSYRRSQRLAKRPPATHQSLYVSRPALQAAGGFDTAYRIAADYDLYLRLVEAGATELLLPDILAEFRLGGVSSRSAVETAREYRDVRVAHGSSALGQQFVLYKSVLAARVVGAVQGVRRAERGRRA